VNGASRRIGFVIIRTIKGVTALLELDGVAGDKTARWTARFQEAHQLVVDSIVGPRTWSRLIEQFPEPL
jgi:peptidoglycan hydrolase-like protein with peptidoglycan-binding domain